jgi:DNA polymerase III epsilon subunit-like protein
MKVLWMDTETTGLDPQACGVVELAVLVDIDGQIKDERRWLIDPGEVDYTPDAVATNGFTKNIVQDQHTPWPQVKVELEALLGRYVDKYQRGDTFIPAGYNIKFDTGMMRGMWTRVRDQYFGSWFSRKELDIMSLVIAAQWAGHPALQRLADHKLSTVGSALGLSCNWHSAMDDIKATRTIARELLPQSATDM